MAWCRFNPMICRRYLLLSLFSIAFAYPLCIVLTNNRPTRRAEPSEEKWGLPGNMRHLASRFDLQYLMDAGGKQAEIDDTPVGDNRGIRIHYGGPEYGAQTAHVGGHPGPFSANGDGDAARDLPSGAEEKATRKDSVSRSSHLERSLPGEVLEIPRIIHQTWEDVVIPGQNAEWVMSWKKHHPGLEYWFWTGHGASLMIHRNFSQYADMYTDYPYTINRADARRYFIMYKYGGIYADLDVESLRPLDDLLRKYKCIIAQEPIEHQVLVYENKHPNYVMPAFIACRPRHPFFKLVLEMLPQHADLAKILPWNDNIFQSTGPMFLAEVLEKYLRTSNRTAEEYIHLAPPSWFMPTYDSMNDLSFRFQCGNQTGLTLSEKGICDKLEARKFANEPSEDSYTTHHWIHSWSSTFLAQGHASVQDILKDYDIRIIS